jgi:hypothetical protein
VVVGNDGGDSEDGGAGRSIVECSSQSQSLWGAKLHLMLCPLYHLVSNHCISSSVVLVLTRSLLFGKYVEFKMEGYMSLHNALRRCENRNSPRDSDEENVWFERCCEALHLELDGTF